MAGGVGHDTDEHRLVRELLALQARLATAPEDERPELRRLIAERQHLLESLFGHGDGSRAGA